MPSTADYQGQWGRVFLSIPLATQCAMESSGVREDKREKWSPGVELIKEDFLQLILELNFEVQDLIW